MIIRHVKRNAHPSIGQNIAWGVGWGLIFAIAFSCYVVILFLTQGPAVFEPYGMTLTQLIGLYLGGGILSGAIVGVLRPLARSAWGAAVVGFAGAVAIAVFFIVAEDGLIPWTRAKTIEAIVLGLLWGPLGGVAMRALFRNTE